MDELITIRISRKNAYILKNYISVNFKEDYPFKNKVSFNELIDYLILKNVGIYYNKIQKETNDKFNTKRRHNKIK